MAGTVSTGFWSEMDVKTEKEASLWDVYVWYVQTPWENAT